MDDSMNDFLISKGEKNTMLKSTISVATKKEWKPLHLGASKNRGGKPPNHPNLFIGFGTIVNHPFWGKTPIFGSTPIFSFFSWNEICNFHHPTPSMNSRNLWIHFPPIMAPKLENWVSKNMLSCYKDTLFTLVAMQPFFSRKTPKLYL